MMDISELRAKLRAVSPTEALEHLAQVLEAPGGNDFENPILTIHMRSGASFRGYLVSSGKTEGERDRHFLISLEIKNERDEMRDVAYINGADIEAVFFFDIDGIVEQLPARD